MKRRNGDLVEIVLIVLRNVTVRMDGVGVGVREGWGVRVVVVW